MFEIYIIALFRYRIDECFDVLKELNYAAREKDDLHGRALYFCNCFDLILETGESGQWRM